jgi:hypothetical protein
MVSINQKSAFNAAGLAIFATLVNTSVANAGIIVNNVSDEAAIAGAFMSDFNGNLSQRSTQIADSFTLNKDAEISEIIWSGQYFDSETPLVDDFTIRFFEVVEGTVSSEPLVELHLGNVERTDSGVDFFTDVFNYSATLASFNLKQGDYLFSITNNTADLANDWAWSATVPQTIRNCGVSQNFDCQYFYREKDGEAWEGYFAADMAFAIAGRSTSVPEPSTILGTFIVLGLGAISIKTKTR